MSRHNRISSTDLFRAQARMAGLVQQIRDDIIYLLERQTFSVEGDPELERLARSGISVLSMRINHDIDRLRRELTLIKRHIRLETP